VQQDEHDLPHVRVSVGQTSAPSNVAESWIWDENFQFETHRRPLTLSKRTSFWRFCDDRFRALLIHSLLTRLCLYT
jgi:hypothetical protein